MQLTIKDVSTNKVLVSLGDVAYVPRVNETIEVLGNYGLERMKVYRVHTEYKWINPINMWHTIHEIHVGKV